MELPVIYDRAAPYLVGAPVSRLRGYGETHASPKLEKKLSFTSRYGDPVSLLVKRGDRWLIPRRCAGSVGSDERIDGVPYTFDAQHGPRNEDQLRVVSEAGPLVARGESFIVEAPTGWGKTWLGCELAAWRDRYTLVVVNKDDTLISWRESAVKFLGLRPEQVGTWRGDTIPNAKQPVVVGMVQSLMKEGRYPDWLYRMFGTVIFDEVHRLGAEEFSKACLWLPARCRVGLSASAQRSDGRDAVFHAHIGPVAVRAEKEQMIPKVLVFETAFSLPTRKLVTNGVAEYKPVHPTPGKTTFVDKKLARDPHRNALIAQAVANCYEAGRRTIVFTKTLEHIDLLEEALVRCRVPAGEIAYYIGGLKKEQYEHAKSRRVILATLTMAGESTDIPWLDTVALTTPMTDPRQPVGRVRREHPEKVTPPIVLDFVDPCSKVWLRWANERRKFYKKLGCVVEETTL